MSTHPTVIAVDTAAELLGMSGQTIRRQITAGTFGFPARKSGNSYVIPARPIMEFLGIEHEDQVSA